VKTLDAFVLSDHIRGEFLDGCVRTGQRGLAEIEPGREALHSARDDAHRVIGLHLAFDGDRKTVERPVQRQDVHHVPKGILGFHQASVLVEIDAPPAHALAVVIARRHAQELGDGVDRLVVGVGGAMFDTDAHDQIKYCSEIAAPMR
jgi:hypothetical protein